MKPAQRGASGLFVAVILLLVAAGALAIFALSRGTAQIERGTQVSDRFKLLQDALRQYVAANGRLPCPANPTLDSGEENPVVPAAACIAAPGQTVPWKVIGVRREDTIDPWGGKITYRVYTGAAGSLTQAGGASMVDCDVDEPLPPKGTDPGGVCNATHGTTEAEFLAGKGLQVTSFGVASTNAAYVLVSHGPSGLGAFTTGGQQKTMPTSADEIANLNATGSFVAKAVSQGVGPENATHFDDLIAFAPVGDLVRRAGRGAREWFDPLSSTTFDAPALTAALGSAPNADTGQSAIAFPGVTVRAFDSGGSQNISFDSTGGVDGIGGAGGGAAISSNGLEGVRLEFGSKARKLGITLNAFGVSGQFAERAELRFFDGATLLATLIAEGCRSASPDPPASFTFDLVTGDFDNVEIRSLVTTPNSGGSTQDSEFLLSAVATCAATAATCQSPLYAAGNACP